MLETDTVRFIQSFISDWLTVAMLVITSLGSSHVHTLVVSIAMLGVSFRKGFLLAHLFLWTSILTGLFKNLLALPRPYQMDPVVRRPDLDFIDTANDSIRAVYRRVIDFYGESGVSYGFPSGHVSSTTAIWGGISLLFRNRILRAVTVLLILLMALSRMYLGRHFLADVAGGLALGAVVLAVTYMLFIRRPTYRSRPIVLYSYLLVLPFLLLPLSPLIDAEDPGRLFGINSAYLLITRRGNPSDSGTSSSRAARVVLGLLLLILTSVGVTLLGKTITIEESVWLMFARGAASHFFLIWGAVKIGTRLRLYTAAGKLS